MHVSVIALLNLPAIQAGIATIYRRSIATSDRLEAIQRPGERARDGFQFVELMAGKQVGMRQSPALQGTLQQRHALLLFRQIFESHRAAMVAEPAEGDN